jgi:hypothetical protein
MAVQTIRQTLEAARRVLPAEEYAQVERWALARPKGEARLTVWDVLTTAKALSTGLLPLSAPLPEFECGVCHHRLKQPREEDGKWYFVCRCCRRPPRPPWARDLEHVDAAIAAAREAGRRRVPV